MTDDQINAAIAQACGWMDIEECPCGFKPRGNPPWYSAHKKHIPNYCGDLNAMHDAEEMLGSEALFEAYYLKLYDVTQSTLWPIRATARHRAEAFLRTLGKWEEVAE